MEYMEGNISHTDVRNVNILVVAFCSELEFVKIVSNENDHK